MTPFNLEGGVPDTLPSPLVGKPLWREAHNFLTLSNQHKTHFEHFSIVRCLFVFGALRQSGNKTLFMVIWR